MANLQTELKPEEYKADVIKNSWVYPQEEEEKPFGIIHSMPQGGMQESSNRRTSSTKGDSVN